MADLLSTNFMSRGFNVTPTEPSPKPPMTPPTRDGFTRDTSSTEERIVVCPACNDELAYDPTGAAPEPIVTSANGRKRKRAPGEHHFWALKKCGHVCVYGLWTAGMSQARTNYLRKGILLRLLRESDTDRIITTWSWLPTTIRQNI